jgi:putative ABC transport system permease protein
MYFPFTQASQPQMFMAVRSSADIAQLSRSLRQALASVEASAAMTPPRAMDDLITGSPSVFMRRLPLFIVGAFALTALLLAVIGIYGVVSYSVAQRTREMGIRTALGAQPEALMQLVVGHGLRLAATGIIVGIGASFVIGRFADALLYGVRAADPMTYIVVAATLAIVATMATILPARRATRIEPVLALRSE